MLKDKYLAEIFPPSHLNKNATLEQIQEKEYEEYLEVMEARGNLLTAMKHDLGFEIKQELASDLVQELYDDARMRIEEARKVIEMFNLSEHHELSQHIRKLEESKTK